TPPSASAPSRSATPANETIQQSLLGAARTTSRSPALDDSTVPLASRSVRSVTRRTTTSPRSPCGRTTLPISSVDRLSGRPPGPPADDVGRSVDDVDAGLDPLVGASRPDQGAD